MREILFKAKRISDGEWVEGYYVEQYSSPQIYLLDDRSREYEFDCIHIDKNTLCQYTGLTDKRGNKIWENDVVRLGEDLYIVTWEEDDAMFALEDVGVIEHFGNVDSKWCEVIGNTFDNTELMKGE